MHIIVLAIAVYMMVQYSFPAAPFLSGVAFFMLGVISYKSNGCTKCKSKK